VSDQHSVAVRKSWRRDQHPDRLAGPSLDEPAHSGPRHVHGGAHRRAVGSRRTAVRGSSPRRVPPRRRRARSRRFPAPRAVPTTGPSTRVSTRCSITSSSGAVHAGSATPRRGQPPHFFGSPCTSSCSTVGSHRASLVQTLRPRGTLDQGRIASPGWLVDEATSVGVISEDQRNLLRAFCAFAMLWPTVVLLRYSVREGWSGLPSSRRGGHHQTL